MKKSELKKIIQEEIQNVLEEKTNKINIVKDIKDGFLVFDDFWVASHHVLVDKSGNRHKILKHKNIDIYDREGRKKVSAVKLKGNFKIGDTFTTELKEDWFLNLSKEKQKDYIKDHPDSKYAKSGGSDNKETKDEGPKKTYHLKNTVTGSMMDVKLTSKELDDKMESLGPKWKVLSSEEYLREMILKEIKSILLEKNIKTQKWNKLESWMSVPTGVSRNAKVKSGNYVSAYLDGNTLYIEIKGKIVKKQQVNSSFDADNIIFDIEANKGKLKEGLLQEEETADTMITEIEKIIKKYFPKSFVHVSYSENIIPSVYIAFAIGQKSDWPNGYFENDLMSQKMHIFGFDKGGGVSKPLQFDPKFVKMYIAPPEGSYLAYGSAKVPVRKKKGDYKSILKAIDSTFAKMKQVAKENVGNVKSGHEYIKKYV